MLARLSYTLGSKGSREEFDAFVRANIAEQMLKRGAYPEVVEYLGPQKLDGEEYAHAMRLVFLLPAAKA